MTINDAQLTQLREMHSASGLTGRCRSCDERSPCRTLAILGEVNGATTAAVLAEVAAERARQDAKWGEQNHPDGTGGPGREADMFAARRECQRQFAEGTGTWLDILDEEIAEAYAETDPARLRNELVQVAAVAVAWIEALDRRTAGSAATR